MPLENGGAAGKAVRHVQRRDGVVGAREIDRAAAGNGVVDDIAVIDLIGVVEQQSSAGVDGDNPTAEHAHRGRRAGVFHLERARVDVRPAGIGVGAGEGQRAGAGFDQRQLAAGILDDAAEGRVDSVVVVELNGDAGGGVVDGPRARKRRRWIRRIH